LKDDTFTKLAIAEGKLPQHRERTAWQLAKTLAGKDSGDLESDFYQNTLKSVISGLGHGDILATIQKLTEQEKPELQDVIRQITRLTRHEFDEFVTIIDGRIRAIETLTKLVENVDFKAAKNENALHELFEKNPWLIDPTYFEFLTSDQTENELADRLAQRLEIGKHKPQNYDPTAPKEVNPLESNLRPDLTFLLFNKALNRVVIVELKAPNTPLHIDHFTQLEGYMARTDEFLRQYPNIGSFKVDGLLIGSIDPVSTAEKVAHLRYKIKNDMGPNSNWRVFDILEVLHRTRNAHQEIWNTHKKVSAMPSSAVP